MNSRSGLLLADEYLKLTRVCDFAAVHLGDHVADLQASLCSGSIRFDLSHYSSGCLRHIEEPGVLRRDISDAHTHVGVGYFPISDQLVNGWTNDLRWDRKSHSRKGT